MSIDQSVPPTRPRSAALPVAIAVVLILLRLLLTWWLPLYVVAPSPHDDAHFVEQAHTLATGHWLGTYSDYTLIKGPGFPFLLAVTYLLGLSLAHVQQALAVLACVLMVVAIAPQVKSWPWRVLFLGFFLFNPFSFNTGPLASVARHSSYPPLTLLVLAAATAILLRCTTADGIRWRWSLLLWVSFTLFWLTREEGMWLLPSVLLLLGAAAMYVWRAKVTQRRRRWAVIGFPLLGWLAMLQLVCTINYVKYGVNATVELKATPFLRAYGALARVTPEHFQVRVPVSRETRARIYPVSPAFAALRPYLEIDAWVKNSAPTLPPGSNEVAGGGWVWALRYAVGQAGYCHSGTQAMAFYNRLADEVNRACDNGTLPAAPFHATMTPPWRDDYLQPLLRTIGLWSGYLLHFDGFQADVPSSTGGDKDLDLFHTMTHSLLMPTNRHTRIDGWAFSNDGAPLQFRLANGVTSVAPTEMEWSDSPDLVSVFPKDAAASHARFTLSSEITPDQLEVLAANKVVLTMSLPTATGQWVQTPQFRLCLDRVALQHPAYEVDAQQQHVRRAVMYAINALYQTLMPWLYAAALACLIVALAAACTGRVSPLLLPTVAVALCSLLRLFLLAYIDVTSFPTLNPQYMTPLYWTLPLFVVLSVAAVQTVPRKKADPGK